MEYPKDCILEKALIFDTHAHYDDDRFSENLDELMCSKNSYVRLRR